jgi:uncharacterized membrane-anchored protein YhcB (DUF1043 family)
VWWLWFAVGFVVGLVTGVMLMALMVAAGNHDRRSERELRRRHRDFDGGP